MTEDNEATRVVERSHRERIDVSAPNPMGVSSATDTIPNDISAAQVSDTAPTDEFGAFETTVMNRSRAAHIDDAGDTAVDEKKKHEYAGDDTGLFVDPDDASIYNEDAAHEPEVTTPLTEPVPVIDAEPGRTGVVWSSMQRERRVTGRADEPKSNTTRTVAICCAVAGVISLAILVFVLVGPPSKNNAIMADGSGSVLQQSSGIKVAVPVSIPSLDAKGSRIPVHVSGKTEGGVEINEDAFISHDGNGLKLEVGTYEVRAAGSPISAEGVIYHVPEKSITITFVDGLVFTQNTSEKLTFTEIAPRDMTLAQINAAYDWVAKDPDRSDRASTLLEAARRRRADAVAEASSEAEKNKAEEQAKAAAEAEAKRRREEEAAAAAAAEQVAQQTEQQQVSYDTEYTNTNYVPVEEVVDTSEDYTDYTDYSGDDTGDYSGDEGGDNTGESTGDNTGESTGDNTGESTGDNTGESTGDNTGDNTGESTGDNTGDNTGEGGNGGAADTSTEGGDTSGGNGGSDTGDASVVVDNSEPEA